MKKANTMSFTGNDSEYEELLSGFRKACHEASKEMLREDCEEQNFHPHEIEYVMKKYPDIETRFT